MSQSEPLLFNVSRPSVGVFIGVLIALVAAPIVWVFVDRLLDPDFDPEQTGASLVQLAIGLAMFGFGIGVATWRAFVMVDGRTRGVSWIKSLYGLRWTSEAWPAAEIEAVAVEKAGSRSSAVYVVGPRGRRLIRGDVTDDSGLDEPKAWAKELGVAFRDERRSAASKPATAAPAKPVTTRQFLGSLAAIAIAIPALFWLQFGEEALELAYGLTAFLLLIVVAIRFSNRMPAETATPAYTPSRFDVLALVWLLAIPFGPFFGWMFTEDLTAGNWQSAAGARAVLCVVLPLIGVLPLLRFVRGRHAHAAATVLLIGTAVPVLAGLTSAYDVIRGPVWQDVEVVAVRSGGSPLLWRRQSSVSSGLVDLSDGRTLRMVSTVLVGRGPAHLLVLRGLNRILDARP